jgi:ribonucleoside-triphosphate reductase
MTDDLIIGNIIIPAEKRQPCEVFSRIVGYLRPVAQWNKGKKAEWADRVNFQVKIETGEVKDGGDA